MCVPGCHFKVITCNTASPQEPRIEMVVSGVPIILGVPIIGVKVKVVGCLYWDPSVYGTLPNGIMVLLVRSGRLLLSPGLSFTLLARA